MKIDWKGGSDVADGFGTAGRAIRKSLKELGHTESKKSDVHITFSHPQHWKKSKGYDIGYFPWESTELMPGWAEKMDAMDEVWVTSPWMAQQFKDKTSSPMFVFEHGFNEDIVPTEREFPEGKIIYLHQGMEAYRKGGQQAMKAFRIAFEGNEDVSLVMKTRTRGMEINVGKVTTNSKYLDPKQLHKLYKDSHFMISNTMGEGFGLPGLDALASGLPVIMTEGILAYEDLTHENLVVSGSVIDSPWPTVHPGLMVLPSLDDLVDTLRDSFNHMEEYFQYAFKQTEKVQDRYNWDFLVEKQFSELESRLDLAT